MISMLIITLFLLGIYLFLRSRLKVNSVGKKGIHELRENLVEFLCDVYGSEPEMDFYADDSNCQITFSQDYSVLHKDLEQVVETYIETFVNQHNLEHIHFDIKVNSN